MKDHATMLPIIERRIATVWIRNKKTKARMKVNAIDYASDLGKSKYRDWELVSEQRGTRENEVEKVSGKSLGIPGEVPKDELEHAEQNAIKVSARAARAEKLKRNRAKADVEVVDKEPRARRGRTN